MKMKRMVASVLALLLVVSLLPISALAMVDNPVGGTIDVPSDESMDNNQGTVNRNEGTIVNNGTGNGGVSSGTVVQNVGTITNNYGTVKQNVQLNTPDPNGSQIKKIGEIAHNYGVVEYNSAIVETNEANGLVGVRDTVGEPVVKEGTGNFGTVNTNNGTITTNGKTVNTNGQSGTILVNEAAIGTNSGTVKTNAEGGTVETNAKDGKIETNNGTVNTNNEGGTVKTNNKLIKKNYGAVGTSVVEADGSISYYGGNEETIELNAGTVTSNASGAEIKQNTGTLELNFGTVVENTGTVEYNFEVGEVTNKSGGEVTYNRGTVNNEKDGTLYEYFTEFADGEEPETDKPSKTITEEGTYYGILIDKGTAPETADAGTWKNGFALVQKKLGEVLDLGSIFKQDGYEVIGYRTESFAEMALDEDAAGSEVVSGTEYTANMPGWLSLIWGKIKTVVKPSGPSDDPEAKTVQNSIPTSLSADQVKVGAYVRRGNLLVRIIEVTDNDIRVATVGKLSEEDLADMLGFLKQHLSDAQIAKIIGEPALLEQELVTYFFGDSYEHIAFRAARDLFA